MLAMRAMNFLRWTREQVPLILILLRNRLCSGSREADVCLPALFCSAANLLTSLIST